MGKTQTKYTDFTGALKALKDGKKVRREAWFTHAAFIYLKSYPDSSRLILVHWNDGDPDTYWEAGHQDYFAEDWVIVE